MLKRLTRRRPSPGTVMGALALFVSLGGVGYSATGGTFILGQANTATSQTGLTSNNAGKALQITQQSTGAGATALGLNVPAGKAPFTTNSGTKVTNLNADKLDGIDSTGFLRNVVPLNLSGSDTTGVIRGTNTADGNGLQGTTSSPTASGVYGKNDGGGYGLAGRSTQPGGIGVYGEGASGGLAGDFNGDVRVTGHLQTGSNTKVDNLNADLLDGFDSSGFVQGKGNVYRGRVVSTTGGVFLEIPGFGRLFGFCNSGPTQGSLRYQSLDDVATDAVWSNKDGVGEATMSPGDVATLTPFTSAPYLVLLQTSNDASRAVTFTAMQRVVGSNCVFSAQALRQD